VEEVRNSRNLLSCMVTAHHTVRRRVKSPTGSRSALSFFMSKWEVEMEIESDVCDLLDEISIIQQVILQAASGHLDGYN
jgi:hypothetical protein